MLKLEGHNILRFNVSYNNLLQFLFNSFGQQHKYTYLIKCKDLWDDKLAETKLMLTIYYLFPLHSNGV